VLHDKVSGIRWRFDQVPRHTTGYKNLQKIRKSRGIRHLFVPMRRYDRRFGFNVTKYYWSFGSHETKTGPWYLATFSPGTGFNFVVRVTASFSTGLKTNDPYAGEGHVWAVSALQRLSISILS